MNCSTKHVTDSLLEEIEQKLSLCLSLKSNLSQYIVVKHRAGIK